MPLHELFEANGERDQQAHEEHIRQQMSHSFIP